MNTAELPMILFTVLAQMSVGAFLTLGALQVVGHLRHDKTWTTDRVTRAALFAVWPLLVLGFAAAFFHLGDPFHALNTFRNFGSSWLSREIVFGVLYGALGFACTGFEWFGWGSRGTRQVLAILTATAGVGLLVSMIQVYYSVRTVPAWHNSSTWLLFLGSALLTGPLAVAVALLFSWTSQLKRDEHGTNSGWRRFLDLLRVTEARPMDAPTSKLTTVAIQLCALLSLVAALVLLVTYPLLTQHLAQGKNPASAHVLGLLTEGSALTWRLLLLALVVVLVSGVAYVRAKNAERPSHTLVWVLTAAFVLAVGGELLGRALHYEGLFHVGLNTLQAGLGG
ncbi:DMSO reductase anchor subunit [Actinomyces bovis]|uniref:DMSO reductase anchor subunit n=1 Tax=Actinomyces bovis TaxID=1658 RepID=A0ABY1VPB3_9ACTO|nr:DmsC/YnfH family molybdoenzyme membrane anchor subunit [Actinomyces bovis]SPT53511.1 DMSO reductase anchor subunit [Actinomyces bovis]VEG55434.1 DMSO reductase anchor subunit [Actinomyces israelii]